MPALVTIGGTNTLFVGEDKVLRAHIKDSTGVPVNIAGWAISFVVRSTDAAVPAVVSATATISGAYNVDPAVNTQRAVVTLTDDLLAIAREIVACGDPSRVHIGLDYFDASINRIAAYVIGARATRKALLYALL